MKNNQGQGLLEMIIAMGIITTGLLSTITLVSASLAAAREGSMRLVAGNLAREGVEVARATRDSNWLKNVSFEEGLVGAGNNRTAIALFGPPWSFDFTPSGVGDAAAMVYEVTAAGDPQEGLYLQSAAGAPAGASPTVWRRLLALYPVCRDAGGNDSVVEGESAVCPGGSSEVGLDVRSRVVWTEKGRAHEAAAEEKIYDWR